MKDTPFGDVLGDFGHDMEREMKGEVAEFKDNKIRAERAKGALVSGRAKERKAQYEMKFGNAI